MFKAIIFVFTAQFLSHCIIGASLNEIQEEEEAETAADDESKISLPVEGTYKIIGTLKNKEHPKPSFVEQIVEVHNSDVSAAYLDLSLIHI